MKPTLFVLAAGMGSRYGGLKQLDGVGPSGETIMDYSIYDAVEAGFGKVVFVIRHVFEEEFMKKIISKYKSIIPTEVVFQELDDLPDGFKVPDGREKPWGTNHALLMGKTVIKEPFAIINADDFYGRDSYKTICDYLASLNGSVNDYCMVGYRLGNTLSDSGSVARGVCEVDENGYLKKITERTRIQRMDGEIKFEDEKGSWHSLQDNTPVSMNMFGFTPDYFDYSETEFVRFLTDNIQKEKVEFLIPSVVDKLISEKKIKMKVLDTTSQWFGVTYANDRAGVVAKLEDLVSKGIYPSPLF